MCSSGALGAGVCNKPSLQSGRTLIQNFQAITTALSGLLAASQCKWLICLDDNILCVCGASGLGLLAGDPVDFVTNT